LRELDNLVRQGLLKAEPGDAAEFQGLVSSGRKRLADAHNVELSPESRFDLAYNAAHALSLAALRWRGYRPNKQRFLVFQALQHTLALKPEEWRVLDKAHAQRNAAEYLGYFDVDQRLLIDLLRISGMVLRRVEELAVTPGGGAP
jgi:hypothetical protein